MSESSKSIVPRHLPSADDNQMPDDGVKTPDVLARRYRFIRRIGQGSQGNVYLAERIADGVQVAVKELPQEMVESFKDYEMFLREAEVLSSLSIVGVAKFYEGPDIHNKSFSSQYLVQEYIPGKTLEEQYQSSGMTQNEVYRLALKLINILWALHKHSPPVIHRDLKPGNIIMRKCGDRFEPYIIDFGAVANPQKARNGSTIAGTYGYMPPEQFMGKASPACDTYALGAIVTYLLSGVRPDDMEVGDDLRLKIEPHLKGVPAAVISTLAEMLDPKLDTRLSDLAVIKARFTDFENGKFSVSATGQKNIKKAAKTVHPLIAFLVILCSLLLAGAFLYYQFKEVLMPEQAVHSMPAPEPVKYDYEALRKAEIEKFLCIVGRWICPNTTGMGDVKEVELNYYYIDAYKNEDISVIVDAMMKSRRVIDGTVTKRLRDGTVKSNSYQHLMPLGNTIALPDNSGVMDFSCTEKTMEVWTFDRNDSLICSRYRK